MNKGKLIVIEGGDGSGKTLQSKLLVATLNKQKKPTEYFDFPQYYHSFHGETVAKFLRGEFGKIEIVSPYLASLPYALDRASVKDKMRSILSGGTNIVANRYATSNLVYQAAKINNLLERHKFMDWVIELEYEVNGIPKEDAVIYLEVPWKIGLQLTKKKAPRDYLKGHDDIHEAHYGYRQKVEQLYLELANKNQHWFKIDCVKNNEILNQTIIHQKIIKVLIENSVI